MKRIWILATLLILTACTAATDSPTPLPSPTATATLTPSATATPSTTPTPTATFTPPPTVTPTAVPTLTACPGGALLYTESDGSYGDEILWGVNWACPENSEDHLIASHVKSSNFAISPSGDRVAFAGEMLQIMDLNSRELTTLVGEVPEEELFHPSWSPDGEYIIYQRHRPQPDDTVIEVIHLPSGTVSEVFISSEYKEQLWYATVYGIEWLPQGDQILVYGSVTQDLYLLDITCSDSSYLCTADNLREIPEDRSIRREPAVSPDGILIAAICTIPGTHPVESSLCILDFNGSVINEYPLADIGVDYAYHLAWSPNGSRIAFDDSLRIYIFSLTDQSLTRFIRGIQPIWLP